MGKPELIEVPDSGIDARAAFGGLALLGVLVLVAALVIWLLTHAASAPPAPDPQAQRIAAQGQADAERTRAAADAALVRAEAAELRADGRHERVMDTLAFLAIALAGLFVAGFAVFAFWDLRSLRRPAPPPQVVYLVTPRIVVGSPPESRIVQITGQVTERQKLP